MTNATPTHTAALTQREEIAEGTMAFHFAKPADFQFRAGQSMDLTLLNARRPMQKAIRGCSLSPVRRSKMIS